LPDEKRILAKRLWFLEQGAKAYQG
jgi:hypothetical protein